MIDFYVSGDGIAFRPIGGGKGGGSSTTTVQIPEPSAEEKALTAKQVELAEAQLNAINQQTALQKELFSGSKELADIQTGILKQLVDQTNSPEAQQFQALQSEVVNRQLEILRRGGAASPEEIALIKGATDSAIAAGEGDIGRFETESFERLREELAPSLGLSPTDTPILDRGGRIAKEGLRLRGDLSKNLRAAEAQARLNFPLAKDQFLAGIGESTLNLAQAADAFQADLRQQALLNRLQVGDALQSRLGMVMQGGLGLATGIPGASALNSAASAMAATRMQQTATSTRTKQGMSFADTGAIMGGIGGIMMGAGAIM